MAKNLPVNMRPNKKMGDTTEKQYAVRKNPGLTQGKSTSNALKEVNKVYKIDNSLGSLNRAKKQEKAPSNVMRRKSAIDSARSMFESAFQSSLGKKRRTK